MRLNNKGFAITLVLYGTLVLFLLLLVSLLGILSTYKLRIEKIYPEVTRLSCNITTLDGYKKNQTLTINSSVANVTYSWNKTSWGVNNTKENIEFSSTTKTYTGYVKNSNGEIAECSIKMAKRKEWRSSSCAEAVKYERNGKVSTFYGKDLETCSGYNNNSQQKVCTGKYLRNAACSVNTLGEVPDEEDFRSSLSDCQSRCDAFRSQFRRECDDAAGGTGLGYLSCTCKPQYKIYYKSCVCPSWGEFGEWQTTEMSSSCSLKVQEQTAYGVV